VTHFLDEQTTLRFNVPLLALEYYAAACTADATGEQKSAAMTHVLIRICGRVQGTPEDYAYLIERMQQPKPAEQAKTQVQKKTFGSSFVEYLKRTDTVQLLALMCDYDMDRVRQLYCKEDHSVVRRLTTNFIEYQMEQNVIKYEAALYGAGGSYKGDKVSGGGVRSFDAMTPQGQAAMAQFGVGVVSPEMLKSLTGGQG
jgi:hypothetical protein